MSEKTKKQQEAVQEVKEEVKPAAGVKEPAKQGAASKTVIYIGPTIKNVVTANTLYSNGLPKVLKEEMTRQKVLKKLVIPVEELADVQRQLATPGSALKTIYDKVITQEEKS